MDRPHIRTLRFSVGATAIQTHHSQLLPAGTGAPANAHMRESVNPVLRFIWYAGNVSGCRTINR